MTIDLKVTALDQAIRIDGGLGAAKVVETARVFYDFLDSSSEGDVDNTRRGWLRLTWTP